MSSGWSLGSARARREQRLEFVNRLSNDAEGALECPPKEIELVDDALHGQGIGEEQQLPRALDVTIPHYIQSANRVNLHMH